MKKFYFLISFILLTVNFVRGQTAGDIAIIGVNSDANKSMVFVALADIPASTSISFTDNAWDATNQVWRTGEGTIVWSTSSVVTAGTVITITLVDPYSVDVGSVTNVSAFNLSTSGDQVLSYLGTTAPTTNNSSLWLYGFSLENFAWGNNSNSSDIPTALINYSVAMTTSTTEIDNAYFANGSTSQTSINVSGTKSELLALFTDASKYYKDNAGPLTFPTYTITINAGTGDTPPSVSNVQRDNKVPLSNQDAVVTATITDDKGLTAETLSYKINGGSTSTVAMSNTTGSTYSGTIPNSAYNDGDLVEYWVSATDNNAQTTEGTHYWFFSGTTSILSIHQADGNGALLHSGAYCRVTGIATVSSGVFSSTNLDVYIQEGSNGVNIYLAGGGSIVITQGNSYTVVGAVAQFNGKTELIPDAAGDITDNGAAAMLPPPPTTLATINANPESYEGTLVIVQHLSKISGTWGPNANLIMTDDAGVNSVILYLDSDTDVPGSAEPTYPIDLRGIFIQYDNSSPYTSGYEIVPRVYSTDIQPDGALPVELSSFSASVVGNAVKLNWATATEVNNYGFEVERYAPSAERQAWEKIGFVNGSGNSNSPKSYSFEDKNVTAGKYSYRLKQIDNDGQFEYSKSIEVNFGAPKKFELSQNYPNPFNPITTISFNLPEAGNVKLTVFNILGQELKTLVNEFKESGVHTINFDASELNSGMYIYKIEAGTFVQTRKMTLVK